MKTNNIDKNIKEKFENRTFKPSSSAWERLSVQLDDQPQEKKKGWFFYIGIAASILLLVSIGIQLLSKKEATIQPKEIIVNNPIDTNVIHQKIDQFINEVPVEEAIVKNDKIDEEATEIETKEVVSLKEKSQKRIVNKEISKTKERIVIAQVDEKEIKNINKTNDISKVIANQKDVDSVKKKILKQNPNSRIKINSDDLLFAVTHSPQEVKEYYAKYNVNREDVLKTIKSELKKSNIKVNPNTILAEVERNIGEEDFQNNFLKSIKRRVSNIATAIASRND